MADLDIVRGYVVGMIGDITRLHAHYYHKNWGFGYDFEAEIAHHIATFLQRYDPQRDAIWTVSQAQQVVASIIIDGSIAEAGEARLRFFIVGDTLRGQGIGNKLMQIAMAFCDEKQFKRVELKTFAGLDAACHLYKKFGFVVYNETEHEGLKELFFERHLK